VPGLGTSFGRGGSTTFSMDMKKADSVMIMGSNMAECHPVAFRWVMEAKTRPGNPATIIHTDPRFTRTSAMANIYAPLRAGSDIVFLGSIIKFILDKHAPIFDKVKKGEKLTAKEQFYHDYLTRYTNAPSLITEEFKDTEADDHAGLFSGLKSENGKSSYDVKKWRYQTEPGKNPAAADDSTGKPGQGKPHSFTAQVGKLVGPHPKQDPTLQDPQCVFQILRRHYERYTPQMVEDVCGTPKETFLKVAQTLYDNSGPEKTGAIVYAVGWTQHTVGVQFIRAAGVVQLLLGNAGRPGGGILALRGHATIQGCTDIPTLYNLLPGYLPAPSALDHHETLTDYIGTETAATSYWANFPKFMVSFLKSWWGDAATAENNYCYDYLPKTTGDHSHMPMFIDMHHDRIKGMFMMGQNPAVGGQNASYQRQALAHLDWMVVRDIFETETASFWKDSPEVKGGKPKPEEIKTEVFFLPAAAVAEMEGSFTNTQRLLQWHEKAVDPPDDCRSDSWFTFHLGRRLKELYKDSKEKKDRPLLELTWDYIDEKANAEWRIKDEPSATLVLKEINGFEWPKEGGPDALKKGKPIKSFGDLKDDGTTACAAWIYTGAFTPPDAKHPPDKYRPEGHNHAANRNGDDWVALDWGFSWPANRRLMYNRASADPAGNPWPKEARLAKEFHAKGGPDMKGYVYWDAAQKKWVGLDVPDFAITKAPDTPAKPFGVGLDYQDGASPFIMKGDGKGWLFVPKGLVDGPMPTHYEPYESPVTNLVYPKQQSNPVAIVWKIPGNPYAPPASGEYPCVLSTYRLTEHHLSGTMSRWLPWLAELQPELFCEISPEHAAEIGVNNTDWVQIATPRATIRAKALVTRRIRPYRLKEKTVYHVGLPWHWGYKGLTQGAVANDLSALVGDPNVTIHEAKVFVCRVTKG
jgi:formate dehydrogenase major subunit